MANKPSVSDSVTKVYQAARDGFSDLTDLLKRLKTEQRKSALETKTKDGNHFVTPLIIAARNGYLNLNFLVPPLLIVMVNLVTLRKRLVT